MDGAPVKGESIPIRVFLAGYDLTPTMRDINKKFSVRYYLNLVLMDDEDRRYFKQQVSYHETCVCFSILIQFLFFFVSYFLRHLIKFKSILIMSLKFFRK